MLDYSDEEPEPESLRRRNYWTTDLNFSEIGDKSQKPFSKKRDENLVDFSDKTQSIMREFRKKTSGLILSKSQSPTTNAFIISEFVPGNNSVSHKSNNFFPDDEDHEDSFYKSMRTLLILAQFFAVFPVSGIRGRNYKSLSFKWIHYKTAYWGLSFLGTVFCFVCSFINGFDDGTFQAASEILHFGCGILSSVLMLSLSRNWRQLNKDLAQIEHKFKKYGYPKQIGAKFKIFTIAASLVALVEHALSKLKSFAVAVNCYYQQNFFILAKSFFLDEYPEIFETYAYSLWKGVLVLMIHFLITVNWNFKDFFLCTINWTVAERFKQVNDLLEKTHGQDKPISFWEGVREDYNNLSLLTKKIDSYTKKLMFISIGNNLFFIGMQLFHSMKQKVDSYELIYFFWSFGFLVLRTGFVTFSAARINDESKEPKSFLYSVPQKSFTAEVRRFLTQLTTNEVALTGGGFFSITRSFILTITGSLITYELILIQFGSTEIEDLFNNRTICVFNRNDTVLNVP